MSKKKYLIEFEHIDGEVELVELVTDRLEWSIDQYCRNRAIKSTKVIKEDSTNTKGMLLG